MKIYQLPQNYLGLSIAEMTKMVKAAKQKYGKELLILGHHYQREEIVELSDIVGDSFGLSKAASQQKNAKYIVFCGVHFMAESARILCTKNQKVFFPNPESGCPLADMADIASVENIWNAIVKTSQDEKIIPITYVNSHSALKAFCGRLDGATCTSSNAQAVIKWGLNNASKVFFFPDKNLGINTANSLNIPKNEIFILDEKNSQNKIPQMVKLILWNGYCHVHTHFKIEHIHKIRSERPNAKIIVHPECSEEVVKLSDESGSTSYIANYVEKAPKGAEIYIGTEINLVNRLAKKYTDKRIFPLYRSLCPNMYKLSLNHLLFTLDNLPKVNEIILDENISKDAKLALERMLQLSQ